MSEYRENYNQCTPTAAIKAQEKTVFGCKGIQSFQSSALLIENNEIRVEKSERDRARCFEKHTKRLPRAHTQSIAGNVGAQMIASKCACDTFNGSFQPFSSIRLFIHQNALKCQWEICSKMLK